MSPRGRTPAPEDQRTGHRKAAGQGTAAEGPLVQQRLVGIAAPPEFSEVAAYVWEVGVRELAELGRLREPDLVLLRGYCTQAHVLLEAEAAIREYGSMIKQPIILMDKATGDEEIVGWKLIENRAVATHGKALDRLRLLSNELGLNPLARVRGNLMEMATSSIAMSVLDNLEKKLVDEEKRAAKRKPAAKKKKS